MLMLIITQHRPWKITLLLAESKEIELLCR